MISKILHVISICILALFLTHSIAFSTDSYGDISAEDWQAGAPAEFPEAGSICLIDHGRGAVSPRNWTVEYFQRFKVLTAEGISDVGQRIITLSRRYEELISVQARTVTPSGEVYEVADSLVADSTVGKYRLRTINFPNVEPGCILEYKCTITSTDLRYLRPWSFNSHVYTLKSTLSMRFNRRFTYEAAYYNMPDDAKTPEVKEVVSDDPHAWGRIDTWYTWEMENLAPIRPEPMAGSIRDYYSSIHFQVISYKDEKTDRRYKQTWAEIGEDYQAHIDTYLSVEAGLNELACRLTGDQSDDRERSKALYRFVRDSIDFPWQSTTGNLSNLRVTGLLHSRTGTAYEKGVLLVALHREIGLDCDLIYISSRNNGRILPDYPDTRRFNRILVRYGTADSYVLMDPMSSRVPYGVLQPTCLVDAGLVIDGTDSRLVSLNPAVLDTYTLNETSLVLDSSGNVTCSNSIRSTGHLAAREGIAFDTYGPERFLDRRFPYWISEDAEILEAPDFVLDSSYETVFTCKYKTASLTNTTDSSIQITPAVHSLSRNPFTSESRFFPVDFMHPYRYRSIVKIQLPDNYSHCELPQNLFHEIEGASFSRQCGIRNSEAVIVLDFSVDKVVFMPEEYEALRGLFVIMADACTDGVELIVD